MLRIEEYGNLYAVVACAHSLSDDIVYSMSLRFKEEATSV